MYTYDIQKRIDAINAIASAKGLREAKAQFTIEGHKEHVCSVNWYGGAHGYDFKCWASKAGSAETALGEAEAWAMALPSIEARKLNEFLDALGSVIDMGRQTGIETDFINPLTATMKRLSENALTYQQAAE